MSNTETAPTSGVTYWDYIQLDQLLSLQSPRTTAHDELLFIMVHQTFELWFRLAIYELRGAIAALESGNIQQGIALLKRVGVILRTAHAGFDPLMTMTQNGYAEFRDALRPASGFQSSQFRVMEILLGIRQVPSADDSAKEQFHWEVVAAQAGETFVNFMARYQQELQAIYDQARSNNLRTLMLRLTEEGTSKTGVDAYRYLGSHRSELPELAALADAGRDLQTALLDFRLSHHKVTVFTIGDAAGTSDAHTPVHSSCAGYLLNVIKEQSTIFPELEAGM